AAPEDALPWLRERLPGSADEQASATKWAADLDSARFADRERAARELERLGSEAEPALRGLLAGRPSPEARRRAEAILANSAGRLAPEALRHHRAVAVLERIGTPDARVLLRDLAAGDRDAR